MIPTIEEILAMLAKGECTRDQALQWIGSHIDLATRDAALMDHFAATAAVDLDADGRIDLRSAIAVMGSEPPIRATTEQQDLQWWCDAEARLRYVKAESMMKARIL